MVRVLVLLPTTTYRAPDFLAAAYRLGVELAVGSEEKNVLASQHPDGYLQLDFDDLERSARTVAEFSRHHPIQAVVGLDDSTTVVAACIARKLSLPANSVESVQASRNKRLMRERLRAARVPIPDFRVCPLEDDPTRLGSGITYPCVLKPTMLAASQGVIRADDETSFVQAWTRIARIIQTQEAVPEILVESFIPGQEVALEGLFEDGQLRVLALFDKPDPLNGPFFEETIYVRPSRLPQEVQQRVVDCAAHATTALGLTMGPVHAELRVNQQGPWVIEVAARPIGGRCSRAIQFGVGISLEELILRQALGMDTRSLQPDPTPSGVMMIPIPRAGVLQEVSGIETAKAIPGVEDVLLTTRVGQPLVPLPEGSRYLGFIFARANTPELVEQALREAHHCLKFTIEPLSQEASLPVSQDCHASSL